jgi:hypothetical protein
MTVHLVAIHELTAIDEAIVAAGRDVELRVVLRCLRKHGAK